MAFTPPWMSDLQAASWRGVAFVVEAIKTTTGRRTAIHEYPYRDVPWVEDLGKALQQYDVQGFLHGDDVAARYAVLRRECEKEPYGDFVHPRFGAQRCALVGCAFGEDKQAGNVVRFSLSLIVTQEESATTLWPVASGATDRLLGTAAFDMRDAGERSFLQRAGDAFREGQAAVRQVSDVAHSYVADARAVVGEATRALNVVSGVARSVGIPGQVFSRFAAPLSNVSRGLAQVDFTLAAPSRIEQAGNALMASGNRARAAVENSVERTLFLVDRL